MAGRASFDSIHSALDLLGKQCWDITDDAAEYRPPEPSVAGLLRLARQRLFKYNKSKVEHFNHSWSSNLRFNMEKLDADWMFLRAFLDSIDRGSDARKVLKKIKAAAKEIAIDLSDAICEDDNHLLVKWAPEELVSLVSDCQRKTEVLWQETGEILVLYLSNCCSSLNPGSLSSPHHAFWTEFVELVIGKLKSIEDSMVGDDSLCKQVHGLCRDVELMMQYIDDVTVDFGSVFPSDCHDVIIEAFLARVASMVLRVANHSSSYWLSKNTDPMAAKTRFIAGLVDLQQDFDPANPELLEFNLKFLRALHYKISRHSLNTVGYQLPLENAFCHCLVGSRADFDFKNLLRPLVKSVMTSKLDNSFEDVHSFYAEVIGVLIQVASHFGPSRREIEICPPPCPQLRIKICLLHAEHFLKQEVCFCLFSTFSREDPSHTVELNCVLRRLITSSQDLPNEQKPYGKQSLEVIQVVVKKVASLYQSFYTNKLTKSKVKISLRQLLLKIVIFKVESFFTELSKCCVSVKGYEKDQVEYLHEQLKFPTLILTHQLVEDTEDVEALCTRIETLARRITVLSYPFPPSKITEEMIRTLTLSFSLAKAKLKEISPEFPLSDFPKISPEFPLSDFPKTHELGFIDFLVRNLGELLKSVPESIAQLEQYILEIQLLLKSFLRKVSDLDIQNPEDIANHVSVAYKLEYVIDSLEIDPNWQHFFWFYELLEELRLLDKQPAYQEVLRIDEVPGDAKTQNVNIVAQVPCNRVINEKLVDLRDEEQNITNRVIRGSAQREIIFIVGMPGIGKTTLAHKVYQNENVINHFHRHAWCTVSQIFEKRNMLLEILGDIHGLTNEIHQLSNEDLEAKLHQCLLKSKYLIVMDDVWDAQAWNDLKRSFPDDGNGSRILVTSRLTDVALRIVPDGDPHFVRPFSDEEAWKLLESKVFQGEPCPKELFQVGKEIAQKCKGLPLAVVTISGLLQREHKSNISWKRIAESLSSEILEDPEAQCREILGLSYKHLPEYLKACFLHLGVFLEDRDISVSKLIRFWLAEGIIQNTQSKCLEVVAEDYLMDLINRNLVMISKRRSNGKVKACRLHDLLRDLCQSKAKEENFLHLVTGSNEPYASFTSFDYDFELDFDHHFDPATYKAHRLSIFLKRKHFVDSRPSGLGTRSLIFSACPDSDPRCPYDMSFILNNFKVLRVLDLECINMGIHFPVEIGRLVLLRYLAVSGYMHSVPESIAYLRNLETFVLKGLRGKVVLPDTIWHMTRLRHLHVNIHVSLTLDDEDLGGCFQLTNLVSFSCPSLSYGEETEKMLRRLPNLCKLRCIFLESWDSSKGCNQYPRLDFLTHLESLKIVYYGRALKSSKFYFPLNLKKLTLSNFHLPWSHISAIGTLPNLEILKLVSGAFEGQRWEMREEEFQELKYLKLDNLNIVYWDASCDHLPKLEQLLIQNCEELEKIPSEFADIATLEMIEVHWCGQSAEESAKEIAEATGDIKVRISSSYLRS